MWLISAPCFLTGMMFSVLLIWIHVYAFAIHFMVHCGSAFEPGASGLPYTCISICVHSWCNWRASCVEFEKEKKPRTKPAPIGRFKYDYLTEKNPIIVQRVCSSISRVSFCVFCSMSLLFDHICMRLPFIPWSSAGVPSSQALPGYLITAPPSVYVTDAVGAQACGFQTKKMYIYISRNWIS